MEDAQARKARLRALRDAAKDKEEPEEQATVAEPALKFRNYNVKDKKIDHVQLEAAQPPKFEAPDADEVVMDDTGATEVRVVCGKIQSRTSQQKNLCAGRAGQCCAQEAQLGPTARRGEEAAKAGAAHAAGNGAPPLL